MKAKLFAVALGSLLLVSPTLRAGETNCPPAPSQPQIRKEGPPRGQFMVIPPQMIEKLNLTEDQKAKLKSIEEAFNKAQQEYFTTHKDEIDAARQAMTKAMSGLQEQRQAAMEQLKALLTPEQMEMLHRPFGGSFGGELRVKPEGVKPPPE